MGSPYRDAVREAVENLQNLAKKMDAELLEVGERAAAQTQSSEATPKWSPTPPTKDGWYWMRHADCVGCTIVEVAEGRVFENGDEWWCMPEENSQFWHGPLQEPAE
jgi:hypothetical protein